MTRMAIGSALVLAAVIYSESCNSGSTGHASISSATLTPDYIAGAPPDSGIWISRRELAQLPTSGAAWASVQERSRLPCAPPNLDNQESPSNICVLAKALVFARTGNPDDRADVVSALANVTSGGRYAGRALALGRQLAAYVIAADLIDLRTADPQLDQAFRDRIRALTHAPTSDGPHDLIECHEHRPNNWGTHCGASRVAVAVYLGDSGEVARVAQVFKGWLGDRSSYTGFSYGDLSWQCDPSAPVGVNPAGCSRNGHSIDGVLPDDQRRAGAFRWPPPKENYVYEALQGALLQATILKRAGYDPFAWQNRALLRAFSWLSNDANFPAQGDDTWEPYVINHFYGTSFPAPMPAQPGKNIGWADWTYAR